jgi:hypothetical protein
MSERTTQETPRKPTRRPPPSPIPEEEVNKKIDELEESEIKNINELFNSKNSLFKMSDDK